MSELKYRQEIANGRLAKRTNRQTDGHSEKTIKNTNVRAYKSALINNSIKCVDSFIKNWNLKLKHILYLVGWPKVRFNLIA